MKEFEVGDKVCDPRYGNGIVETIDNDLYHPVFVRFEGGKTATAYTVEGREGDSDLTPMLYHGHGLVFEAREPERFYVNLYWNNVVEKELIESGIWLFKSKKEAKTHGLKSHKYIKTVEILK